MTKDEALKLALEAIEELRYSSSTFKSDKLSAEAIAAIKEALAQPKRPWVSLTNKEIKEIVDTYYRFMGPLEFAAAIEAKLKEKNFD